MEKIKKFEEAKSLRERILDKKVKRKKKKKKERIVRVEEEEEEEEFRGQGEKEQKDGRLLEGG